MVKDDIRNHALDMGADDAGFASAADYRSPRSPALETIFPGARSLVLLAYGLSAALTLGGLFPHFRLLPLAVVTAVPPVVFMRLPAERRGPLIPLVMLHHLVFGFLFCLSWFMTG